MHAKSLSWLVCLSPKAGSAAVDCMLQKSWGEAQPFLSVPFEYLMLSFALQSKCTKPKDASYSSVSVLRLQKSLNALP